MKMEKSGSICDSLISNNMQVRKLATLNNFNGLDSIELNAQQEELFKSERISEETILDAKIMSLGRELDQKNRKINSLRAELA